jgi:hypothetical protein
MGFKLRRAEKLLRQFVQHCEGLGADAVTIEIALHGPARGQRPAMHGCVTALGSCALLPMMPAARSLPSPVHQATFETLVGLLWASGMRVGEPRARP